MNLYSLETIFYLKGIPLSSASRLSIFLVFPLFWISIHFQLSARLDLSVYEFSAVY